MKINTNWYKETQTTSNLLLIFRILLLPAYLYLMLRQPFYVVGTITVVSGLSGYLGEVTIRGYNRVMDLGRVLDPFADKLTQLFPILSMAWYQPWPWLLFDPFLMREGLVPVAGLIGLLKNIKLSDTKWYGRVAAAVVYVGMILLLPFPELPTPWVRVIFAVIIYGLLQSFALYIVKYRKMSQER